jgi:hypothetical protein
VQGPWFGFYGLGCGVLVVGLGGCIPGFDCWGLELRVEGVGCKAKG